MRHFIFLLALNLFLSCGQNDTKQKELELREREIAIKEKELALKQTDSSKNNVNPQRTSPATITTSSNKSDLSENNLGVPDIKVPITVAKINSLVGQYNVFEPYDENEDPNNGAVYKWKLKDGLLIKGQSDEFVKKPNLSHKIIFIVFSANDKTTAVNCAFGLSLNKSTLNDCKQLISNLKKSNMGQEYYKFIKDNVYYYLHFNANNVLIEMILNSQDWENSGG